MTTDEHAGTVRERTTTWADPAVTATQVGREPGLALLEAVRDGRLPAPPIATTLGFDLDLVEDGRAVFSLEPAEHHYNPIGSVHGGVYATLCDSACGCAVHSMLPAGAYYTSLDLSVRFIRQITAGTGRMLCEGTVEHLGSRTALATARLTDRDGKLYAQATSSCMIFRPGG